MRILVKGRQSGKTTKLIIASEVTGYPILTPNKPRKHFIEKMAKEMGCNIPEPISYESRERYTGGLPLEKILIDDAEEIIERILRETLRADVVAVAITDNDKKF